MVSLEKKENGKGGKEPQKQKKWHLRYLPLGLVLLVLFSLVAGPFFGGDFNAQNPSNLLAGDAYWHLFYVEYIHDVGNYNYEPREMLGFTDEKLVSIEPPLIFYYSAFLSSLLGIPSYVAVQFGFFLMLSVAFSAVYMLFARYDFRLAMLMSPFFLLTLNHPFIAGITWGLWKAYLSFLIFFFSLLLFPLKLSRDKIALLGILLGAIILSHPAIMPYVLLSLLIMAVLSEGEKGVHAIPKVFLATIFAAIVSSGYMAKYLVNRVGIGSSGSPPGGGILVQLGYGPYTLFGATPFAEHFGNLWYLAVAGFMLSLCLIVKLGRNRNYLFRLLVLFSFLFLVFFMPYLGFGRVYQFRLVWPIVVSVFIGLLFYMIVKSIPALKGRLWPFVAVFLLSISLLFSLGIVSPPGTYSIFGGETWDAYKFIAENTPQNAKILVIDPTLTQDAIVFYTKRYTRFLDFTSFNEMVRDNVGVAEKETSILCGITADVLKNEVVRSSCEKRKFKTCEFDYILANLQVKNEAEAGVLNEFFASLEKSGYRKVAGGRQTVVLQNPEVCRNAA